jgi:adenylate kinase family enzyme
MSNIIFITGPSGAGKSTISRQVADHYPRSVHLQVDHLRDMTVKGAELPAGQEWTDEATRQFQLARSTAIFMAKQYAEAGFVVVIDDVCVPADFAGYYSELFKDPTVSRVLLLPTQAALTERMQKRNGPYDHILIQYVPWFYNYLDPMPKTGWIVLDTSDLTVERTAQEVLRRITP